jgi:LacI family transcriptional regulator
VVSDELKARVCDAAEALGYVANRAAQALVRRDSGLIGIVIGVLDEARLASSLTGLAARLSEAGWTLLLGTTGKTDTPLDATRMLVSHNVEALVFLGPAIPDDLETVRGVRGLPCVGIDPTGMPTFGAGAEAGFRLTRAGNLAAEYLRSLGHRRLAAIVESGSTVGARMVGALGGERGPEGSSLEIVTIGDGPLANTVAKWLALPDPPTAAICESDAIALALIQACAFHGIDVPGRISVVGFGDTVPARCATPALTSVRVPARNAGIAAAEYLLARLGGCAADGQAMGVKLVVRASTGRAP